VLGELGVAEKLAQTQVLLAWSTVVGPLLAAHTRPLRVGRGGRLEIAVPSASWRTQLAFMRVDLVRRLNDAVGHPVVRDLILLNHPLAPPSVAATAGRTPPRFLPVVAAQGESVDVRRRT
jgi:hypothetical protein